MAECWIQSPLKLWCSHCCTASHGARLHALAKRVSTMRTFDYGYLVHVRMCVGVFAAVPCCSQPSQQQWPGLCDSLAPGGQSPLCHRAWVNSRARRHMLWVTEFRDWILPVSVPADGSWPWGCSLCGCWLVLGLSLFQKWLRLWYYLDSFRRHPPWIGMLLVDIKWFFSNLFRGGSNQTVKGLCLLQELYAA